MVQNQKKFGCTEGRKLVEIYLLCKVEDNRWNLLKLFDFYSLFFKVLRISVLFVLFD